jgi:GntR family transcriptional repressor for pyruvate dehydrogenase complex
VTASRVEDCIQRIKELVVSGELAPGTKIPSENVLAELLGSSRNTLREAVSALAHARVLDVRRGDGTYVTSLEPDLLLDGISFAVDLMQTDVLHEIFEMRRILEPSAAALAAQRATPEAIRELRTCLEYFREAEDDPEKAIVWDADFHRIIAEAAGNRTLLSVLNGIAKRTISARIWRGLTDRHAYHTIAEHEQILWAIEAHEPTLAHAAALVHLGSTESWVATLQAGSSPDLPLRSTRPSGEGPGGISPVRPRGGSRSR